MTSIIRSFLNFLPPITHIGFSHSNFFPKPATTTRQGQTHMHTFSQRAHLFIPRLRTNICICIDKLKASSRLRLPAKSLWHWEKIMGTIMANSDY